MKKIILGMAVMLAGAAFSGNAQSISSSNSQQQAACPTEQAQCSVKDGCKGVNCPFEGLNLTEEQQVKIRDLNNALEVSKKELKQEANTEKKDLTARRKELRTQYVDELEKILSHDQFVSYLKNYYINGSQNAPKVRAGDKSRFGKVEKAGKIDRKVIKNRENGAQL